MSGYMKNKLYFYGASKLLGVGIAVGVIGLIIMCAVDVGVGVVGIIIGGLLGYVGWLVPSDSQIDRQAGDFLLQMDGKAFKKMGIDASEVSAAAPVKFWGYRFTYPSYLCDEANDRCPWKVGGDNLVRSSEVVITGFYFGENSVYCYECTLSLVSNAFKESTEEYFYRDVVSVKTETSDKPFIGSDGKENPRRRVRSESFIIRNMGGESRVFNVKRADEAEAAVNSFRALLKQKKV